MIVLTRKAYPEYGEWTVWKHSDVMQPVLRRASGDRLCRRAKRILIFPVWHGVWFGLFWTFGPRFYL